MRRSRPARSSPSSRWRSRRSWLCARVFRLSTVTRAISLCRPCVSASFCATSSRILLTLFLLLAAARSEVVCSLDSSSILETRPVMSRETPWMLRSTTSRLWLCSAMLAFSFVVSSTCESMDFLSMLNWSISRSLSCLMESMLPCRCCCSLSFLSLRDASCSCRSCSWRIDVCNPRMSFSTASSCSFCSWSACWTFCSASSRRCMPTRDDRHCCMSCFFSNSMASISLPASRRVVTAASVSCFCAVSCASSRAFCSVIRFTSSFMLSMRTSCLCLAFSMVLIWSSAL
mmetsp:Transcript_84689/g.263039  ORF Transcript_84689/g.263039 Transcript_84689/m.263039 type:complete len:287 (-) Transcript_84689:403-1263(-)